MNKPPQNNELDDLLKVIETQEHDNITDIMDSSVVDFCVAFNLKQGNTKVSLGMVYKLYQLWYRSYKKTGVKKLTHAGFTQQLRNKFKLTRNKELKLSITSSELNEHIIHYIRNSKPTKRPEYSIFKKEKIERFLSKYNLASGDIAIDVHVLYYLYDLFCYDNNMTTIFIKHFSPLLKLYIDNNNNGIFYVNSSIYKHITKEQIEEILSKGVRVKERNPVPKKGKTNKKKC
jgi:hypothetical protein